MNNQNPQIKQHPLFKELTKLKVPTDGYAIFMSGALYAYGLREEIDDLDIIATGNSWKRFSEIEKPVKAISGEGEYIGIVTSVGDIEVYDCWYPKDMWEGIDLVSTTTLVEGFPIADLEHVKKFKEWQGREKDLKDIERINEYLYG